MNLSNLIDNEGLQQDEWSLSAPTFGNMGQLKVIGWSGRTKPWCGAKFYIVECSICSSDTELFGNGVFRISKGDLLYGSIPCGCAKKHHWSMEQYIILCNREASKKGYSFIDFADTWEAQNTKVKLVCKIHGVWESCSINNLLRKGTGCPGCKAVSNGIQHTKGDEDMVESFLSSGSFHPDTKFWRSDRLTKRGYKDYWCVDCPECGEIGESVSGNLQRGQRPCACSKHRQQECYINLILDDAEIIAVKFGIANNSKRRVKSQNKGSMYKVCQHSVYTFADTASCKRAERECLQELECGVVLRRDMKDGYTETTWAYNLEKIIEIYERNGGIKVD